MINSQVYGGRGQTSQAYTLGVLTGYLMPPDISAPPVVGPTLAITDLPPFADVDASATLAELDRSATVAIVD